jgi:hypothetical protein
MIDKIILRVPRTELQGLLPRLKEYRIMDVHTGAGRIGTMRVLHNMDCIRIRGSLPKYLRGQNVTPLTRHWIKDGIRKLEDETGLDLSRARVDSLEVGTTIILSHKPGEYLRLFGDLSAKFDKNSHSKAGELLTVSYGSSTGSFQFCAYDKGREMKDKREELPELYRGSNCLRLEYRIIKRQGIRGKFNRDLTAHDLFDYDVYGKLQSLFYEAYRRIPKMGRLVYVDTSKPLTPARLEELEAERYRQSFTEEYNHHVQILNESGCISKKNLQRIRARNRRNDRDYSLSDKNHLIAELDCLVQINCEMTGTKGIPQNPLKQRIEARREAQSGKMQKR